MKIYGALVHAWPLAGNPYHGKATGTCSIQYYALAEDTQMFADRLKQFLVLERWKLDKIENPGVMSRELLLASGKQHIVESLDSHGDAAMIHWSPFSDN
jgi:hypothetical protein